MLSIRPGHSSKTSIQTCRERFSQRDNLEYFVTDGSDLGFIPAGSVDAIWSFDVFVHLAPSLIEAYIEGFSRILGPAGGRSCTTPPPTACMAAPEAG